MGIIIEDMICPQCSNGNCLKHQSSIEILDKITGLKAEVRCICQNHKKNEE